MSDQSQFNAEQFEAELAPALLDVVRRTYLDLHRQPECGIRVTLDSSLDRERGFDSLARAELLTRVKGALGVSLPETTLQTAETPRDLLAALRATSSNGGAVPRNVRKLCRLLCRGSLIVIEQSTKSMATDYRFYSMRGGGARHDQHIAEALVVALVMKVGPIFSKRAPQHPLPGRDQPR